MKDKGHTCVFHPSFFISLILKVDTMKRDLTEHIEAWLTQSALIRGLASAIQKVMSALFLNSPLKPLKTFLNGTWLEHPLHPVLTDVPVGAWTAAIVLDLIALIFGVRNLGVASAAVIALGVVAAIATIITGLMDWMDIDTKSTNLSMPWKTGHFCYPAFQFARVSG